MLAIFVVDVATGPLIGFALFYLVPIGVAAWRVGRRPGVAIAILAFVAWLVADLTWRPANEFWAPPALPPSRRRSRSCDARSTTSAI